MSQIKRKFIANNAVDGSKIRLENNQAFKALDSGQMERYLFYFSSANQLRFAELPKVDFNPVVADDLVRKAYVDQEISSAVSAEQVLRDAAVLAEQTAREAADASLQTQINNILSNTDPAALDSLAEVVAAFQSADGDLNAAISALGTNSSSALAQEISAREAADLVEQSARIAGDAALQASLTQEVADRAAAVSTEASARTAGDAALQASLTQEVADRAAAVSTEASAREAADMVEASARIAGDAALQTSLTQEISDRMAAVSTEASAREAADAAEQSARIAGDAGLQSQVDTEKARIDAILLASDADKDSFAEIVTLINSVDTENDSAFASYALSNNAALAQEVSDRVAGDAAEASARDAAVQNLQNQINTLDSGSSVAIDAEQSARIAADAALQASLTQEISDRAAGDTALQASLTQEISDRMAATLQEQVSRAQAINAEAAAREAADVAAAAAREAKLPRFAKLATTLSAGQTHVDLMHAAKPESVHVFIDRLALHVDDDYTLSTVNGVTRVTLSSGLLMGEEAPAAGDLMRCGYAYANEDQASGSGGSGGGGGDTGGDTGGGGGGGGGGGSVSNPTLSMMFISETSAYIAFDVAAQSGDYIRAWANSLPVSNPVSLSADELGKSIPLNPGLQLANGTTVSFFYYRADNSLVGETVATWTFNTGDTGGGGGGGGGGAGPEMLEVVTMSTSSAFITWASGSGWQSGDYISASKPGGPLLADYTYVGPGETAANVGFDPSTLSVGDYVLFNYHRADGGVVNYTAGQWNG